VAASAPAAQVSAKSIAVIAVIAVIALIDRSMIVASAKRVPAQPTGGGPSLAWRACDPVLDSHVLDEATLR
jgi:hypothetical protein